LLVSCRIFKRVVDDRSGRLVEELVKVLDEEYSPEVALSVFCDDEVPPAGTYVAECGHRGTATVTFAPPRAGAPR
jgi:hypothetical protein